MLEMEKVSTILRWVFTYIFYPAVIISVFISIIAVICTIVDKSSSAARSLIGVALPVVVLVFIIASDVDDKDSLANLLEYIPQVGRFVIGALVGVSLFATGKKLMRTDSEIGFALYNLFLSTIEVFILYCMMSGITRSIHILLLGLMIGGGLYVIFMGLD